MLWIACITYWMHQPCVYCLQLHLRIAPFRNASLPDFNPVVTNFQAVKQFSSNTAKPTITLGIEPAMFASVFVAATSWQKIKVGLRYSHCIQLLHE